MPGIIDILKHQGKQYIPDLTAPELKPPYRGRPVIAPLDCVEECNMCDDICPSDSIILQEGRVSLDLGKCVFCGDCQTVCPIKKIAFTSDYRLATNDRKALIIAEGNPDTIRLNPDEVREEIYRLFKGSLKLRSVSAGGDNADEMELNAAANVNFDMGRYGIDWVASPRHADGIVISGPISAHMAEALEICYHSVPDPKIVILAGTSAISGGLFAQSPALDRSFLEKYSVDLYVPGYPPHPLTFVNGVLDLVRNFKDRIKNK